MKKADLLARIEALEKRVEELERRCVQFPDGRRHYIPNPNLEPLKPVYPMPPGYPYDDIACQPGMSLDNETNLPAAPYLDPKHFPPGTIVS